MSTYSPKASEIEKKWVLIDAEGLVVGRLATVIATRLRGKHKPTYAPHLDCGDNIIVINAEKVVLTGNKLNDKTYHWHTGYIGGIKERTPREFLAGGTPEKVSRKAVNACCRAGLSESISSRTCACMPEPSIARRATPNSRCRGDESGKPNTKVKQVGPCRRPRFFDLKSTPDQSQEARQPSHRRRTAEGRQAGPCYATGKRKNAVARYG